MLCILGQTSTDTLPSHYITSLHLSAEGEAAVMFLTYSPAHIKLHTIRLQRDGFCALFYAPCMKSANLSEILWVKIAFQPILLLLIIDCLKDKENRTQKSQVVRQPEQTKL